MLRSIATFIASAFLVGVIAYATLSLLGVDSNESASAAIAAIGGASLAVFGDRRRRRLRDSRDCSG